MDYDSYTLEEVNFIQVSGEINVENCTFLKNEIMNKVEQSASFLLDFRNVTYIDSTGIGTLMAMSDLVNKRGGRIKLVGLRQSIMRILELVNAANMFDFYERSEDALQDFRPPEQMEAH